MKFVALALTILFAAGSQARFLQADAPPSQLDQVRAGMAVYLAQVKSSALKALDHLDSTDYKQYKQTLTESLDKVQNYVVSTSQTLAPYTNAASEQFMEITKTMREQIVADVDSLKTELGPKREELKLVLHKHLDEYRSRLEPVYQEYVIKHKAEMAELKAKLEPVVADLRELIKTNLDETKSKLMPIVEAIRGKLTERLKDLKAMVGPYAEEYKELLSQLHVQKKGQMEELKEKVGPLVEDVKAKLIALWASLNQPAN